MKKTTILNCIILILSSLSLFYYAYQLYNTPIKVDDSREKEYINMEIKREQIKHALRYAKERQYEEAVIILNQINLEHNPYGLYLKGRIFYKIGKKEEGLSLIKDALQRSHTLYDLHYPNNIRNELEEIVADSVKMGRFQDYRHFIESKLKGGCG